MGMYASNAGKSGGEFFTPSDVSELLTRLGTVGKTEINKVYDPACGSGSLLLKALKVLGKDAVRNGFFGQEINITTYNLCRINMFLHDVGFDKFDIACEDTLISPQHWDDEPFELIVSNPPYSVKWAGDDNPLLINDPRFAPAGVLAPKSKADLAFIMHSLAWLAPNGTAAIVCFPGIMYRGGNEQKIRKYLIDNNFIDCIIQLPDNLFFGTTIATCIMVLKKGKPDSKTLFIDASKECIKVTNNNKLTAENLDRIVDAFAKREEKAHFSYLASYEEVVKNNYDLSVSTYVEAEDMREPIDIEKLNVKIAEIVAREQNLRKDINQIVTEIEGKSSVDELIRKFCPSGVEYKTLGELGEFFGGITGKSKTDFVDGNAKFITYKNVYSNPALNIDAEDRVRIAEGEKQRTLKFGDVIFTGSSETPDECGISSVITIKTEEKLYLNSFCFVFRFNNLSIIEPDFAKHLFRSEQLRYQIGKTARGVTRFNVSKKMMANVKIPVPPIEVQREIVRILDNFTELTAELTARKKQYECYRDKLLAFSEKQ